MRRICSFTDLFFLLWFVCACRGAGIFTDYLLLKAIQRRIGAKTIRSKSNINWQHKKKMKSVKEQIRRIRVIRDRFWTWRRSRRRKSTVRSRRRRSTLRPVWKTIPSEARVTRDEVSGLKPWRGGLSGRQYQRRMGVTFSIVKSEEWRVKNRAGAVIKWRM